MILRYCSEWTSILDTESGVVTLSASRSRLEYHRAGRIINVVA